MTAAARREPILNVPWIVAAALGLLVAVHAVREMLPVEADDVLVANLSFVPLRLTAALDRTGAIARIAAWSGSNDPNLVSRASFAAYLLGRVPTPAPVGLLTYAALHGGWAHLGLNGIWFLAFGTPVARRFGPARFCALLVVSAVSGAITHWGLFPFDTTPLVGASAAVSGCMGAALRFAFRTVDADEHETVRRPGESLAAVLRDKRALSFLIVWFVSNALFGVGSTAFGLSGAPVAWQAHVGGFLAGLLLFRLFDPAPRPAVTTSSESPRGDEDAAA